ncbi:MAG TPA: arylamine N-acetyltransferase [Alphaproteobacteria bacterium]|nr:arylamine N-acetyltransferase [Alphaproteobacteria bacterium]
MQDANIDLDAYFRRIGYHGPRDPTLDSLTGIHAHHIARIPFENLDVLLGRPIRLDPASLGRKLIDLERGGYCFEQNGLMAHVLRALGFRVTTLAARVRFGVADPVETSRSHMLLEVDLPEGPYLVDVGFGGQTPGIPLQFEPQLEQVTAHGLYRIVERERAEGEFQTFELQNRTREGWAPLYRFTLEPQLRADYEVASWWVSTNPESIFVRGLMVARQESDRRHTLLNNQFTTRRADGRAEEWTLSTVTELAGVLRDYFLIDTATIAGAAEIEAALARYVAGAGDG